MNTRYAKQEDVARGYNPHKPGRRSHHPLLCVVAGTRLALYMEWRPGNEVSAGHWIEAMERVWSHPDVPGRLQLNRGDSGFAQEKFMAWHEMPRVARPRYLFKPKLTANVRRAIAKVPWPEWDEQPSIGMEQYAQIRVKLDRWSCERRVIVTRILKPTNPTPQDVFWGLDQEEFCAYVTNLDVQQATPPQIVLTYRKRGDAENVLMNSKTSGASAAVAAAKAWSAKRPLACCFSPKTVELVCACAQGKGLPPRGDHQPRRPARHPC